MKKFLSIALLLVLVASVFVVASNAAKAPAFWSISPDCLVNARVLDDGTVPTFKQVEASNDVDGLIVGLPTSATVGDDFFEAKDGYYILYINASGDELYYGEDHLGTTDKIVVYDENDEAVATYGLVTYGDADGDGVFDVIDASIAALCLNDVLEFSGNEAVYEAVKPRIGADNDSVLVEDYQQVVNDCVKDESELEENLKGRKIPVDETIAFDSAIYACDGKAKTDAVTVSDSNFKNLVTIKYNDSTTAPSASGIYAVTAVVPDSEEYLVTPGTRNLGFIAIAPKTGTGYTTIVDNANRTITIDITNPNAAGADLTGYINSWVNPSYSLNVSSKNVTNSTELASSLGLKSYNYYQTSKTNIVSITEKTITDTSVTTNAALGCYLPDDYTLWANNLAENSKSVSVTAGDNNFGYTIVFRQNPNDVEELDRKLLLSKSSAARGQRKISPPTSSGVAGSIISFITEKEVFCEAKSKYVSSTGAYENCIRTVVGSKGMTHPLLASSLGGTGLKSLLVGDNDTISFVSSTSKANLPQISKSNEILLYDTSNNNQRYVALGSDDLTAAATTLLPMINEVLGGLNISVSVASTTSELIGKSGWCRYACADDVTGLRYTTEYYLEFANVNNTEDAHRTMIVEDVAGCTITTTPSQEITEVKSNGVVTSTYYHKERMVQYEPFKVSATLADGYKLSVKDASGNDVYYDAENDWYIMPASNVTVTAVKA